MGPEVVPLVISPNIGVHTPFRGLCALIPVIHAPVRLARVPFKVKNANTFLVSGPADRKKVTILVEQEHVCCGPQGEAGLM